MKPRYFAGAVVVVFAGSLLALPAVWVGAATLVFTGAATTFLMGCGGVIVRVMGFVGSSAVFLTAGCVGVGVAGLAHSGIGEVLRPALWGAATGASAPWYEP